MKERRWTYGVRDERGKRHRGIVSYGEDVPSDAPEPPAEFRIALLARSASVTRAPAATAICLPKLAKTRAIVDVRSGAAHERELVAALKQGALPATQHAQYEAGRVILPAGEVHARKVFPRGKLLIDFEHVALLLIDQAHAEALAPYMAIIRRELRVTAGANPLLALQTRLYPADPAERPPASAPGIARLRAALRRLKAGALPRSDMETMIEDLRFLRLFERQDHTLKGRALDRLLADVIRASPTPPKRTRPAPVVSMRRTSTRPPRAR